MYENTVFQFKKMLVCMDGLLVKAAAHADAKKYDVNILTHERLAPDMFALTKQIQVACDQAKFCAAYLTGQTAPKHEDNETTWKDLRERIKKTVAYLETFKAKDFANAASTKPSPGWAKGQWVTAEEYVNEVALPNFYFHMTTVYALLRSAGVDIGKMDFLGHVNFRK
jgi:hypothetical protein